MASSAAPWMAPAHAEEDAASPTTALLRAPIPSPSTCQRLRACVRLASLAMATCVSVGAAFAFLFFSSFSSAPAATVATWFSSGAAAPPSVARPLAKLPHPVVLMISFDGFRFGYQFKADAPSIRRLIANGTEAEAGLIPVFPTLTFPNHYSIVTGLYPSHHGIINNYFVDPANGDVFTMRSHEPKWWLGEPLWETAVNQGLKAATFFWPGSEVRKGSWLLGICLVSSGGERGAQRHGSGATATVRPSKEACDGRRFQAGASMRAPVEAVSSGGGRVADGGDRVSWLGGWPEGAAAARTSGRQAGGDSGGSKVRGVAA